MMLKVALLLLVFAVSAFSLECVFEVHSSDPKLDLSGGTDQCESNDDYCIKVMYPGVNGKGCLSTATKFGVDNFPTDCDPENCSPTEGVCCCKGNKSQVATNFIRVTSLMTTLFNLTTTPINLTTALSNFSK